MLLDYDFIIDDLAIMDATEKAGIKKPKSKLKYFWTILMGSAYWDDLITRRLARGVTILCHLIVCSLIYFAFGQNNISLLTALLFLIHPLNTEVSFWVSGKIYSFPAMGILIAWLLPVLGPVIFISPMMGISGIFAPLIFLLKFNWWSLLALFVIATLWRRFKFIFTKEQNAKLAAYDGNKYVSSMGIHKLIIAIKFYGYYLVNNLFGIKFCFYQSYMDDYADTQEGIKKGKQIDGYFFVGLFFIGLLIYGLFHFDLWVFGLFWASINIAQWCNFINVGQQYIANRQAYMSNIGLMLALSSIAIKFPLVAGLLIGWYLRQTIYAVLQYQNVYWHLFFQILNEPKFYYSWINMGNLNFARGNFTNAISDYLQADMLRPNNFKALFNLSSGYMARGNVAKAIAYLEKARKADVYGQEGRAAEVLKERAILIKRFIEAKGNIKLQISDIVTIA